MDDRQGLGRSDLRSNKLFSDETELVPPAIPRRSPSQRTALHRHGASCIIGSMRAALKLLLFGLISASISTIVLPVQAKMVQMPKTGCCEHMTPPNNDDGDCGGIPVKSSPDRQCCAGCALGLTLFLAMSTPLIYSPTEGQTISSDFLAASDRSDQPPVPPPRIQFV